MQVESTPAAQQLQFRASMIRVDLHLHSRASFDGWASPEMVVQRAVEADLDKIAITDHGEIWGAQQAYSRCPERVVVGEEIHCDTGTHLIGLFLDARIPHGMSVSETAGRIRDQGGVVYAPHPYAYLTGATRRAAETIAVSDVIEVFNSRGFLPSWNRAAARAAMERGLPAAASSDSHFPYELGRAYTELPKFTDAAGFLQSLGQARPVALRTGSPWLHVASRAVAEWRRIFS